MTCHIIPPYLLERLAQAEPDRAAARSARLTLEHDRSFRATPFPWTEPFPNRGSVAEGEPAGVLTRTIGDAEQSETLPGRIVRREGEPATGDPGADEAYDGLGATYRLLEEVYGHSSVDGSGMGLDATVHYGVEYDNAFWDGNQMVFGDGDGEVFRRFTLSLTVIGHELAHGLTQFSAGLVYADQPGALNESISDVFGALVEQYAAGQTAQEASWLIGAGLFTDEVQGVALRSMRAPGTAYDDDVLGKDPQPAHMDHFVVTRADHGGVHINSGIPNRAFYEVAVSLGGHAWERAGWIWYLALTDGNLAATADFAAFAGRTEQIAAAEYGSESTEHAAVIAGWAAVGVTADGANAVLPVENC